MALVLDTKWKLLDETQAAQKYGLLQSDFYQMHAYAVAYLGVEAWELERSLSGSSGAKKT